MRENGLNPGRKRRIAFKDMRDNKMFRLKENKDAFITQLVQEFSGDTQKLYSVLNSLLDNAKENPLPDFDYSELA